MASILMPTYVDNIRLATLNDLSRIATVAAAGFFWSPVFQFQRPYYAEFPEDTLFSYRMEYEAAIQDPASVVLVAEDKWDPTESEHTYEALRGSPGYTSDPGPRNTVIVGVCSIDLKPGSAHVGLYQTGFQVESCRAHPALSKLNRDQNAEAVRLYNETTAPAKKRYLTGQMRLSTLAVHPAYRRRGHATRLVNWCTTLADNDGACVGVSAAPMGATLAAKAGFEEQEIVRIERCAAHTGQHLRNPTPINGIELWIAIRQPCQTPSDTSITSSSSPDLELQ